MWLRVGVGAVEWILIVGWWRRWARVFQVRVIVVSVCMMRIPRRMFAWLWVGYLRYMSRVVRCLYKIHKIVGKFIGAH